MSSNEEIKKDGSEKDEMIDHLMFRRSFRRRFIWKLPLIAVFIALKAGLVMWLWNYLIPDLFHGPVLDYGHAIGLMILAKLLFGFGGFIGFGAGRHFGRHHHHHGGRHGHWKARWMQMTPEEREKLRSEFKRRCRRGPFGDEAPTEEAKP